MLTIISLTFDRFKVGTKGKGFTLFFFPFFSKAYFALMIEKWGNSENLIFLLVGQPVGDFLQALSIHIFYLIGHLIGGNLAQYLVIRLVPFLIPFFVMYSVAFNLKQ